MSKWLLIFKLAGRMLYITICRFVVIWPLALLTPSIAASWLDWADGEVDDITRELERMRGIIEQSQTQSAASTDATPAPDSISTKLEELLLEFAEQVATDGVEDAGQFEREAVALYLPQFTALLHQYAQRQVAAELRAILAEADKQRPTLVAQHRLDEIYGYDAGISAVTAPIARRLKHLTQEQTP